MNAESIAQRPSLRPPAHADAGVPEDALDEEAAFDAMLARRITRKSLRNVVYMALFGGAMAAVPWLAVLIRLLEASLSARWPSTGQLSEAMLMAPDFNLAGVVCTGLATFLALREDFRSPGTRIGALAVAVPSTLFALGTLGLSFLLPWVV